MLAFRVKQREKEGLQSKLVDNGKQKCEWKKGNKIQREFLPCAN
jgi:hypothetical protein